MKKLEAIIRLLCSILSLSSAAVSLGRQQPPVPVWPDIFSIDFDVFVEDYGENWESTGALQYHWPNKTFRADYFNWCLPLFDSGPGESHNYTCSFLATEGNMYFVNHSSLVWDDNECCLFEAGLAATPPDWMKVDQYNGTSKIRNVKVDVWWFPGTNDPTKPCYGYWSQRNRITPVRFFGLSSVGPTILDYSNFQPGEIKEGVDLSLPLKGCDKECHPPMQRNKRMTKKRHNVQVGYGTIWPTWPSCD